MQPSRADVSETLDLIVRSKITQVLRTPSTRAGGGRRSVCTGMEDITG